VQKIAEVAGKIGLQVIARRSPLAACRSALARGFIESSPAVSLDEKGYVSDASLNLVEGVALSDVEADLRQGDGNELKEKFRAAHSSAALAVNAFGPFKAQSAAAVPLLNRRFTGLCFEQKCSHGLVGRRPPNLDALAFSENSVVAIESKCLEYLSPHVAKFSDVYRYEITDSRSETAWFRTMLHLRDAPRAFSWMDAAQLVKHVFGLAHTFPDRRVTLLYLFWEPSNPESHPVFAEHRAEIARFAAMVDGEGIDLAWMSYPELWTSWDRIADIHWLPNHVWRLRARYAVAI
jgi:hypothetical protein